jgi:hypothetical protein
MLVTVIVKYDAPSADIFVGIIKAPLSSVTEEQRNNLRKALDCDGHGETNPDDDEVSNLFFRELELTELDPTDQFASIKELVNVDGERG